MLGLEIVQWQSSNQANFTSVLEDGYSYSIGIHTLAAKCGIQPVE